MVITFWPHPRIVLGKNKKIELLSTMKEKENIFKKYWDRLIICYKIHKRIC